jgi:hypothetical protein
MYNLGMAGRIKPQRDSRLDAHASQRFSRFAQLVWELSNESLQRIVENSGYPMNFRRLERRIKRPDPDKELWTVAEAEAIAAYYLCIRWGDSRFCTSSGVATVEAVLTDVLRGNDGDCLDLFPQARVGCWHPTTRSAGALADLLLKHECGASHILSFHRVLPTGLMSCGQQSMVNCSRVESFCSEPAARRRIQNELEDFAILRNIQLRTTPSGVREIFMLLSDFRRLLRREFPYNLWSKADVIECLGQLHDFWMAERLICLFIVDDIFLPTFHLAQLWRWDCIVEPHFEPDDHLPVQIVRPEGHFSRMWSQITAGTPVIHPNGSNVFLHRGNYKFDRVSWLLTKKLFMHLAHSYRPAEAMAFVKKYLDVLQGSALPERRLNAELSVSSCATRESGASLNRHPARRTIKLPSNPKAAARLLDFVSKLDA